MTQVFEANPTDIASFPGSIPLPEGVTPASLQNVVDYLEQRYSSQYRIGTAKKMLNRKAKPKFWAEVIEGVLYIMGENLSTGDMLTPFYLRINDSMNKWTHSFQLGGKVVDTESGTMSLPLPEYYGKVSFRLASGRKSKRWPDLVASARPELQVVLSYEDGGQTLLVNIENVGGDIHEGSRLLIFQANHADFFDQAVMLLHGEALVVKIKVTDLAPDQKLRVLSHGITPMELDIPDMPAQVELEVIQKWLKNDLGRFLSVTIRCISGSMDEKLPLEIHHDFEPVHPAEEIKLAAGNEFSVLIDGDKLSNPGKLEIFIPPLLYTWENIPPVPAEVLPPEEPSVVRPDFQVTPINNGRHLYIIAANVGTTPMPCFRPLFVRQGSEWLGLHSQQLQLGTTPDDMTYELAIPISQINKKKDIKVMLGDSLISQFRLPPVTSSPSVIQISEKIALWQIFREADGHFVAGLTNITNTDIEMDLFIVGVPFKAENFPVLPANETAFIHFSNLPVYRNLEFWNKGELIGYGQASRPTGLAFVTEWVENVFSLRIQNVGKQLSSTLQLETIQQDGRVILIPISIELGENESQLVTLPKCSYPEQIAQIFWNEEMVYAVAIMLSSAKNIEQA